MMKKWGQNNWYVLVFPVRSDQRLRLQRRHSPCLRALIRTEPSWSRISPDAASGPQLWSALGRGGRGAARTRRKSGFILFGSLNFTYVLCYYKCMIIFSFFIALVVVIVFLFVFLHCFWWRQTGHSKVLICSILYIIHIVNTALLDHNNRLQTSLSPAVPIQLNLLKIIFKTHMIK